MSLRYRSNSEKVGELRMLNDNIAVRLVMPPGYNGSIIIPDKIDDTSISHSRCVQVLAIGPGRYIKYKLKEEFVEGSKAWRWARHHVPAAKPNKQYVGDVNVGEFYIMHHPFCANHLYWAKDIPEYLKPNFPPEQRKIDPETREEMFLVKILQAHELDLHVELEEGETEEVIMERIEYGKQISIG